MGTRNDPEGLGMSWEAKHVISTSAYLRIEHLKRIDYLIEIGEYESRSDFLRDVIRSFIRSELEIIYDNSGVAKRNISFSLCPMQKAFLDTLLTRAQNISTKEKPLYASGYLRFMVGYFLDFYYPIGGKNLSIMIDGQKLENPRLFIPDPPAAHPGDPIPAAIIQHIKKMKVWENHELSKI
jgi:hypothetical protein